MPPGQVLVLRCTVTPQMSSVSDTESVSLFDLTDGTSSNRC